MRILRANKRLMTVFAISLAACLAIPYALATPKDAPPPTMPVQCTTTLPTGWSSAPIINARMTVHNYEDVGGVGYWALDNFQESFIIWQNNDTTPNTFCSLDQYSGSWMTFAGAFSPQSSQQSNVSEPHSGSGGMDAAIVKIFTGTFLGPYCKATGTKTCSGTHSIKPTTGYIGAFNLGGNRSQILLGTYVRQAPFNPTSYLTYYFNTPSITSEPVWSWTYTRSNGVGYGRMWVDCMAGSFGDIITGR